MRIRQISHLCFFFLILAGVLVAQNVQALTVSPSYTGDTGVYFLPSSSLMIGEREYDRNIDFGPNPITTEQAGEKRLLMIRNDFVFADRFTMGFNIGVGTLDHGVLRSGTDTLDLDGEVGAAGGVRISGVFAKDLVGLDWFGDFQYLSLNSDPKGAEISQDDWHFALGGRERYGHFVFEGGARYISSKFEVLGTSQNDTVVAGTGEAATNIGYFFNTRFPMTLPILNQIQLISHLEKHSDGFFEVAYADELMVNAGASYRWKLGDYHPPVSRKPVPGARTEERAEQGESAEAFLRRARRAIRENNYRQALDYLSQAVDLDPQDPEVYFQLGRSYFLVGEFGEAELYLRHAADLKPSVVKYHYYLARTYEKLDRVSEAAMQYEKVLELNPSHQRALYRLNRLGNGE